MSGLCRHFGTCGGCLTQDLPEDSYRAHKRQIVVDALTHHGVEAEVSEIVSVRSHTRRRATFKAAKEAGETLLGFYARASHDIVDMHECRLLTPKLFAAVPRLRAMMAALLREGEKAELHVTETDDGLDLAIAWKRMIKPALTAELARWAGELKFARIAMGDEIAVALARPTLRFGNARVALPLKAFLQPTREGEAALQNLVLEALDGAKQVADLFSGCGTFTLPLAERARVHAVELDARMLEAMAEAARHTQGLKPLTTEQRDLFKVPLSPPELKRFDAVLLDPPRAGALAQVKAIAASKVRRIAYVSCNPASFARDARVLIEAGFHMGRVTPVDQFLWSDHVELVAAFVRK